MIGRPGGSAERPALFFADAAEFRLWLEENHATATELWMGLNKAHVAPRGLTWAEAVPQALCFGWIDSIAQRIDDDARRQRWTPRRKGSIWSEANIAHVERLTADGLMAPAGLAAYEARRADRSGVYSFEQDAQELSAEHAALLAADPLAQAWWDAAPPSYRKQVTHWINTAKRAETRDRRLAELIADSAMGQLVKPHRYGDEPQWAARNRAALGLDQG